MSTALSHDTKRRGFGRSFAIFRAAAAIATICVCAASLLLAAGADQQGLPRDALWEVVHYVCVPGESEHHEPMPCLQVDLTGGIDKGFAILKDPRGGTQFLLIPTTPISGIESPIVRGPNATNYFSDAWEVRTHIEDALNKTLPRDEIGLAINSAVSRSQDQLHIHFSCIREDVFETLHSYQSRIGTGWAPFNVPFLGRYYDAMWVSGEHLAPHNPFTLLAQSLPEAVQNMSDRTLVVIGFTRTDGARGFVILTDQVNKATRDVANGEDLLDNSCQIAAAGDKAGTGFTAH